MAYGYHLSDCICLIEGFDGEQKEELKKVTTHIHTRTLCPECNSDRIFKDGLRYLNDGSTLRRFLCRECGYRFSDGNSNKSYQTKVNRQV